MTDQDSTPLPTSAPPRRWMPAPGCLFVVAVIILLTAVASTFAWRVHCRYVAVKYVTTLDPYAELTPARPVWLLDLAVSRLGLEWEPGFLDVRSLRLDGTDATDTGLEHLCLFTGLKSLTLDDTFASDDGMSHLSGLIELESLSLNRLAVTDAGLQSLSGLAKLRKLALNSTGVTDAGLPHLYRLTQLQSLQLYGTDVTPAGVAQLRARLPACNVCILPQPDNRATRLSTRK